jgi:hypothetical protein
MSVEIRLSKMPAAERAAAIQQLSGLGIRVNGRVVSIAGVEAFAGEVRRLASFLASRKGGPAQVHQVVLPPKRESPPLDFSGSDGSDDLEAMISTMAALNSLLWFVLDLWAVRDLSFYADPRERELLDIVSPLISTGTFRTLTVMGRAADGRILVLIRSK